MKMTEKAQQIKIESSEKEHVSCIHKSKTKQNRRYNPVILQSYDAQRETVLSCDWRRMALSLLATCAVVKEDRNS